MRIIISRAGYAGTRDETIDVVSVGELVASLATMPPDLPVIVGGVEGDALALTIERHGSDEFPTLDHVLIRP